MLRRRHRSDAALQKKFAPNVPSSRPQSVKKVADAPEKTSALPNFLRVRSRVPLHHLQPWATGTDCSPAPGLGSPLPHRHRDWARPCHIGTGTGLTPATSAPGPGSQAIEILSVLVVYYIVAANIEYGSIGLLTWSMWFVAFCWFFTPFWFNPLAFDWSKTLRDFEDWTEWMKREVRALHSTVQPVCAARSHCA